MADVRRLIELGLAPELAKEVARQIEEAVGGAYTDADAVAAVAAKPEIAALVPASATPQQIVEALQA